MQHNILVRQLKKNQNTQLCLHYGYRYMDLQITRFIDLYEIIDLYEHGKKQKGTQNKKNNVHWSSEIVVNMFSFDMNWDFSIISLPNKLN